VKEDPRYKVWLKDFQYKPGWKVGVEFDSRSYMHFLRITMMVPNRDNPREVIPVMQASALPEWDQGEEDFWRYLRSRLHDLECHEADEMFLVNGKRVFDPHKGER